MERRSGVEPSISKFEQDIYQKEGSLPTAGDKTLDGDSNAEHASGVRNIEQELQDEEKATQKRRRLGGNRDINDAFDEMKQDGENEEQAQLAGQGSKANKDGEYRMQHNVRGLSPERNDPFGNVEKPQDPNARRYYVGKYRDW